MLMMQSLRKAGKYSGTVCCTSPDILWQECCLVNTQAPITTLPKWSLGIVLLKVRDPTGRDHFLKVVPLAREEAADR